MRTRSPPTASAKDDDGLLENLLKGLLWNSLKSAPPPTHGAGRETPDNGVGAEAACTMGVPARIAAQDGGPYADDRRRADGQRSAMG